MKKRVVLIVDGKTQAWQRIVPANPFNKNSKPHKQEATVRFQEYVKFCYGKCTTEFFTGPVKITVFVCLMPPKSASKKKYEQMICNIIKPEKKPDWDNLGKNISDALNGIAYPDDAHVTDGGVKKRYASQEFAKIVIEEDDEYGIWERINGEWEFIPFNPGVLNG